MTIEDAVQQIIDRKGDWIAQLEWLAGMAQDALDVGVSA